MFALRLSDTVPREWYRAERERAEQAEGRVREAVSFAYDDAFKAAESATWRLIYYLSDEEARAVVGRIAEETMGPAAARLLATATNPHMILHDYVTTKSKEGL